VTAPSIGCDTRLELRALSGVPLVAEGAGLADLVADGLARDGIALRSGDVVVLASKVVSRAEGRYVDLTTVVPSGEATRLAAELGKDARMVELVLRETIEVSRTGPGVLIVKNRLGVVCANAGIDITNSRPLDAVSGSGPWALLLPEAPDRSADRLREALAARFDAAIGVIITDSVGRPFRFGTVGIAIGVSGLPPLWDQRGAFDLFGTRLEQTITALADQVAAAADLVAGQAAERRGIVHVRGLSFPVVESAASALVRPVTEDLYARAARPGARS
jgi:coenzyme F420-0:L-glutamate ligase/coenzyme F420-1:gamma-L-glutamate ligase